MENSFLRTDLEFFLAFVIDVIPVLLLFLMGNLDLFFRKVCIITACNVRDAGT